MYVGKKNASMRQTNHLRVNHITATRISNGGVNFFQLIDLF